MAGNYKIVVAGILLALGAIWISSCGEGPAGASTDGSCIKCDTLYLGYRFGMSEEEFFGHCREMNRRGILFEGDELNTVTQEIDLTVDSRIYIRPLFDDEDKIYQLDLLFQYNVLPMFRKDLTPAKLRKEVLEYMEKELGEKLKPRDHPVYKRVWENVQGHRRLRLFHEGERIKVEYYDLRHEVTG